MEGSGEGQPGLDAMRRLVSASYLCQEVIGEGAYGVVVKARHRATGRVVAIKMFKESGDDELTKRTGMRELQILRALRHDNIVMLLEAFMRENRLFLVFEHVQRTLLDDIERSDTGLPPAQVRDVLWQLLAAIDFCHRNNVVHRDIKPENLLLSESGVLKLCDFGFARKLKSTAGAVYTDYVSTRWYRSPELLVGDTAYGMPVDVWAIGCLGAELATGMPLFPGESDLGTLAHVVKTMGALPAAQARVFERNPLFREASVPVVTAGVAGDATESITARVPSTDTAFMDLLQQCLVYDPEARATTRDLISHPYFSAMRSSDFAETMRGRVRRDRSVAAAAAEEPLEADEDQRQANASASTSATTTFCDDEDSKEADEDSVLPVPHQPPPVVVTSVAEAKDKLGSPSSRGRAGDEPRMGLMAATRGSQPSTTNHTGTRHPSVQAITEHDDDDNVVLIGGVLAARGHIISTAQGSPVDATSTRNSSRGRAADATSTRNSSRGRAADATSTRGRAGRVIRGARDLHSRGSHSRSPSRSVSRSQSRPHRQQQPKQAAAAAAAAVSRRAVRSRGTIRSRSKPRVSPSRGGKGGGIDGAEGAERRTRRSRSTQRAGGASSRDSNRRAGAPRDSSVPASTRSKGGIGVVGGGGSVVELSQMSARSDAASQMSDEGLLSILGGDAPSSILSIGTAGTDHHNHHHQLPFQPQHLGLSDQAAAGTGDGDGLSASHSAGKILLPQGMAEEGILPVSGRDGALLEGSSAAEEASGEFADYADVSDGEDALDGTARPHGPLGDEEDDDYFEDGFTEETAMADARDDNAPVPEVSSSASASASTITTGTAHTTAASKGRRKDKGARRRGTGRGLDDGPRQSRRSNGSALSGAGDKSPSVRGRDGSIPDATGTNGRHSSTSSGRGSNNIGQQQRRSSSHLDVTMTEQQLQQQAHGGEEEVPRDMISSSSSLSTGRLQRGKRAVDDDSVVPSAHATSSSSLSRARRSTSKGLASRGGGKRGKKRNQTKKTARAASRGADSLASRSSSRGGGGVRGSMMLTGLGAVPPSAVGPSVSVGSLPGDSHRQILRTSRKATEGKARGSRTGTRKPGVAGSSHNTGRLVSTPGPMPSRKIGQVGRTSRSRAKGTRRTASDKLHLKDDNGDEADATAGNVQPSRRFGGDRTALKLRESDETSLCLEDGAHHGSRSSGSMGTRSTSTPDVAASSTKQDVSSPHASRTAARHTDSGVPKKQVKVLRLGRERGEGGAGRVDDTPFATMGPRVSKAQLVRAGRQRGQGKEDSAIMISSSSRTGKSVSTRSLAVGGRHDATDSSPRRPEVSVDTSASVIRHESEHASTSEAAKGIRHAAWDSPTMAGSRGRQQLQQRRVRMATHQSDPDSSTPLNPQEDGDIAVRGVGADRQSDSRSRSRSRSKSRSRQGARGAAPQRQTGTATLAKAEAPGGGLGRPSRESRRGRTRGNTAGLGASRGRRGHRHTGISASSGGSGDFTEAAASSSNSGVVANGSQFGDGEVSPVPSDADSAAASSTGYGVGDVGISVPGGASGSTAASGGWLAPPRTVGLMSLPPSRVEEAEDEGEASGPFALGAGGNASGSERWRHGLIPGTDSPWQTQNGLAMHTKPSMSYPAAAASSSATAAGSSSSSLSSSHTAAPTVAAGSSSSSSPLASQSKLGMLQPDPLSHGGDRQFVYSKTGAGAASQSAGAASQSAGAGANMVGSASSFAPVTTGAVHGSDAAFSSSGLAGHSASALIAGGFAGLSQALPLVGHTRSLVAPGVSLSALPPIHSLQVQQQFQHQHQQMQAQLPRSLPQLHGPQPQPPSSLPPAAFAPTRHRVNSIEKRHNQASRSATITPDAAKHDVTSPTLSGHHARAVSPLHAVGSGRRSRGRGEAKTGTKAASQEPADNGASLRDGTDSRGLRRALSNGANPTRVAGGSESREGSLLQGGASMSMGSTAGSVMLSGSLMHAGTVLVRNTSLASMTSDDTTDTAAIATTAGGGGGGGESFASAVAQGLDSDAKASNPPLSLTGAPVMVVPRINAAAAAAGSATAQRLESSSPSLSARPGLGSSTDPRPFAGSNSTALVEPSERTSPMALHATSPQHRVAASQHSTAVGTSPINTSSNRPLGEQQRAGESGCLDASSSYDHVPHSSSSMFGQVASSKARRTGSESNDSQPFAARMRSKAFPRKNKQQQNLKERPGRRSPRAWEQAGRSEPGDKGVVTEPTRTDGRCSQAADSRPLKDDVSMTASSSSVALARP